jgi:glycosyltransferase involved in cell wall biosynthesis
VFNETRFLVAPSRKESFGLVVSEAMACGTPCICSDIRAFREKVIDQENGYLFRVGNANDLSESIQRAVNTTRQEYLNLSDNCKLIDNYSLAYVCNELIEIYRN